MRTKEQNIIIQKITGLSIEQLFLNSKYNTKFESEITSKLNRLKQWEALEYIINEADFYSIKFFVDNRVLIPRNETEIIVEEVLKINYDFDLIDVWTWSSCIPISIIKNSNKIKQCFAVDISKKALEVSNINIQTHQLQNKITTINGNLINNFLEKTDIFNSDWNININNIIITANLPYIKNNDIDNIDKETLEYEPSLALFWGPETWFELYEKLIFEIIELQSVYNTKKITLFIEIWFDQTTVSSKFLNKLELQFDQIKDHNNIIRFLKISF